MTRIRVCLAAIALIVMLGGGIATAASESGCTVRNVNWNDDGTYRFMNLVCTSGSVYWAFQSNSDGGCSGTPAVVSLDSIKIYQSLATAARLSGKPLTIWYSTVSTCWGGVRAISGIEFKD
jgi:hypothetical protein